MPSRPSPESLLPIKPIELLILSMLSAGDRHGYGIRQDIVEHTQGALALEAGNLYRTIRRLEQDGLVDESGRRPAVDSDDERRRYYRLTPFGRKSARRRALREAAARPGSTRRGAADNCAAHGMTRQRNASTSAGERAYRLLLRLYPAAFRARYGDDMVAFYHDRIRHTPPRAVARLRLWLALSRDVVLNAAAERVQTAIEWVRPSTDVRSVYSPPEESMSILTQDIRFALRGMIARPIFSATILATLGASGSARTRQSSASSTRCSFGRCPTRTSSRSSTLDTLIRTGRCLEPEFVDYQRGVPASLPSWPRVQHDGGDFVGVADEANRSRRVARVDRISSAFSESRRNSRADVRARGIFASLHGARHGHQPRTVGAAICRRSASARSNGGDQRNARGPSSA